jgi:hypothetical protein
MALLSSRQPGPQFCAENNDANRVFALLKPTMKITGFPKIAEPLNQVILDREFICSKVWHNGCL